MPPGSTVEGTGIAQLEADLIAGLESSDRSSLLNTLRLLQALDKLSLDSVSVLKHFLVGKDPEIALAIHAVLIQSGDPEEVACKTSSLPLPRSWRPHRFPAGQHQCARRPAAGLSPNHQRTAAQPAGPALLRL